MLRRILSSSLVLALVVSAGAASADIAPPRIAPAPSYTITDGRLALPSPFAFEAGSDTLTPGSRRALAHVAGFLEEKTYITLLRLEDHVAAGTPDGQALSERRALAVARALVARGVDCKRLIAVGFGDNKPVAANDTAEGRAANTRVEVAPATLRDRPIGGMPVDGGGKVAGDPCG